jgi:hypothetical protein
MDKKRKRSEQSLSSVPPEEVGAPALLVIFGLAVGRIGSDGEAPGHVHLSAEGDQVLVDAVSAARPLLEPHVYALRDAILAVLGGKTEGAPIDVRTVSAASRIGRA